ncbi:MAG: glycosyltransferase family 4 protein, partial [Chloroflexota bacterium]
MRPNRLSRQINKAKDIVKLTPRIVSQRLNTVSGRPLSPRVFYFVPGSNWAADWVGRHIVNALQVHKRPVELTTSPWFLRQEIIHFNALGAFVAAKNQTWPRKNKLIVTVFHGFSENDPHEENKQSEELIQNVHNLVSRKETVERFVTTSTIMKNRMLGWGLPENKITRIPLGIDLDQFKPAPTAKKSKIRQQLGIPEKAFVVGSFQKDGVGWGEGMMPKYVKGPDYFVEAMVQAKKNIPNLFVLLTGPARGFVKKGLSKADVPFIHNILPNFSHIPQYYQALDCYLVASREEGGPKAVLEAQAAGVPLITTRVG